MKRSQLAAIAMKRAGTYDYSKAVRLSAQQRTYQRARRDALARDIIFARVTGGDPIHGKWQNREWYKLPRSDRRLFEKPSIATQNVIDRKAWVHHIRDVYAPPKNKNKETDQWVSTWDSFEDSTFKEPKLTHLFWDPDMQSWIS